MSIVLRQFGALSRRAVIRSEQNDASWQSGRFRGVGRGMALWGGLVGDLRAEGE